MNNDREFLLQLVRDSLQLKAAFFHEQTDRVVDLAERISRAHRSGHKVLVFGNGGSAADAQHFAAELMHRVEKTRLGIRALALHTDTSLITAVANDEGFGGIYSRQIETLAQPGDLVIAITTSGNSPNIIEGLRAARRLKCETAGLLGRDGGRACDLCDTALIVPGTSTPRIQEVHEMIIHLVCQMLERKAQ